jgi:hypothetical protein
MAKKKHSKPAKRKTNSFAAMRGCITVIAELCGIAGFLLALYIFLRSFYEYNAVGGVRSCGDWLCITLGTVFYSSKRPLRISLMEASLLNL